MAVSRHQDHFLNLYHWEYVSSLHIFEVFKFIIKEQIHHVTLGRGCLPADDYHGSNL